MERHDVRVRSKSRISMTNSQGAYSRRGIIRRAAIIAGGGALTATGFGQGVASAQAAKVTQSAAQYQATPKAKAQCSGCTSFIAPGSCKLVSGAISPSGWCILFAAKS
jgi:hypothetical protein